MANPHVSPKSTRRRWARRNSRTSDGNDPFLKLPAFGTSPQTALAMPIAALAVFFTFSAKTVVRAGDILRGGRAAAPATSRGISGQGTNEVATAAAINARDALARTSKAVSSIRAMQDAAHQQARNKPVTIGLTYQGKPLPAVPNGLVTGGLMVAPGVPKDLKNPLAGENASLWSGASLPGQKVKDGQTIVTIRQNAPRASLSWETFNIGKKTSLVFDQKAGGGRKSQWIAFNRVNDPSGIPSQILGSLEADGQVYIINRNGIVFGGSSVVNTHTLVASSLAINENLITRGLLNQETKNPQFLFSSIFTDPAFQVTANDTSYTISQTLAAGTRPRLSFRNSAGENTLELTTDYTLTADSAGRTVVNFTEAGAAKVQAAPVTVTYTGHGGDVVVQKGAQLTSPTTAAKVGGRIALVGPNVKNAGTISTPDGQTILAAGRQVGFAAHSSDDPSLRGLDVFVGVVDGQSGLSQNTGLIDVPRASVTMTGKKVEQLAVIDSTTSVTLNGRIDLQANYGALTNIGFDPILRPDVAPFLFSSTGTVTLGEGSVTRILPELGSEEKVVGTELALRSQANLQGKIVHLQNGASLLAPNALVSLDAGVWNAVQSATNPINTFIHSAGQIYLERGSSINVAGTPDVNVKIGQNLLTLQLRGAELADSPLQRTGALRGLSLTVDIRQGGVFNGLGYVGTPLGDASGFAGLIERTAAELTLAGGTVNLRAGNSVVLQRGAEVDVSGGYIDYKGGIVQTSRVQAGAQLLDISQATPDQLYDGVYTGTFLRMVPKWGVAETFRNPLAMDGAHFEAGYLQGANGGSILITAPSMALDSTLRGHTISGERQRATPAGLSSLTLSFTGEAVNAQSPTPLVTSPTPPSITFGDVNLALAEPFLEVDGEPAALRADRIARVFLSPSLYSTSGFGRLTVDNGEGDILLPAGVNLEAPVGGSLSLVGANITVLGGVSAPGGSLSFAAYNTSPYLAPGEGDVLPTPNAGRGRFTLGSTLLSTAGLVVDDRNGFPIGSPLATNGGSISIQAFDAQLLRGSTIDVSGGVGVDAQGVVSYQPAGSLLIAAGQDPRSKSVIGGGLSLQSKLRGFSGTTGGSLSILAPRIVIGGAGVSSPEVLHLSPGFFSSGGFSTFTLTGLGALDALTGETLPGLWVLPGTTLQPVAQSWLAVPNAPGEDGATLQTITLPVGLRAPFSLNLNAQGVSLPNGSLAIRGDLVMGSGASITVDPRGQVSLVGETVAVLGHVRAPGGSISVVGDAKYPVPLAEAPTLTNASPTVYLGRESVLDAAGTLVRTPDVFGRRTGTVLSGGSIRVAGNIVADQGALLNVSGSSGTLDLAPAAVTPVDPVAMAQGPLVPGSSGLTAPLWSTASIPMRLESDGGSITLQGGEELFVDATLRGDAGGATALGGTLSVSSGRFYSPETLPEDRTNADINLIVTQSGLSRPQGSGSSSEVLGQPVLGTDGSPLAALGHFAVERFSAGGFDSLNLGGNVQFQGNVSIQAARELSVASGGVLSALGDVRLSAAHVSLGQPFLAPLTPGEALPIFTNGLNQAISYGPSYGRGRLTVEASLIDVGNLSLQQIGRTTLIAQDGDIRGNGTLDVAGDLILRAGQVYPATGVTFTIAAYDKTVNVATSELGSATVTLASALLPTGFGVGSNLLGSKVQSINGTTVTLAAGADRTIGATTAAIFAPGSIRVEQAGERALPLSAAGTLNLYSSYIYQDGTLRAPLGTINLGWDGTGTAPQDPLARRAVPMSNYVQLGAQSMTSVSAIDPTTGEGLMLPFGYSSNGRDFINPAGVDITAGLVPGKAVTIAGKNVGMMSSAAIDQRGGGDLYAYRFNRGIGGTTDLLGWNLVGAWQPGATYKETQIVSYQGAFYYARTDLDSSTTGAPPTPGASWRQVTQSFAVLPNYEANFAPYATFNSSIDPGYAGSSLGVGDRIHLQATSALAEGTYTLLPARYALLPGAVLVTPQGGTPFGTLALPDGSATVAGYRFNDLNGSRELNPVFTRFEVASSEVVRQRGDYQDFFANTFLADRAKELGLEKPRLPEDAGHTILQSTQAMQLLGDVLSQSSGGTTRAGLVDIASGTNIVIGGSDVYQKNPGALGLNASVLNSWGAESLLIGGTRTLGSNGAVVTVRTGNITVSNAGSPLSAPDIILAAKENVTLSQGASIIQSGPLPAGADRLILGDAKVAGSGNGVLLRVSADPSASVARAGVDTTAPASLNVQAGVQLFGGSIILDSTSAMFIDSNASLRAESLALNTGSISMRLDESVEVPATGGLILEGALLQKLQDIQSLSLLSYSTFDIYGAGHFDSRGSLAIHAGTIRGFGAAGGLAEFSAQIIKLDNLSQGAHAADPLAATGTLAFNAGKIQVGANNLYIDQYANVQLNASQSLRLQGKGSLSTQADLTATTPTLSANARAVQGLNAGGALTVQAPANGADNRVSSGLGAKVTLQGSTVNVTSDITLPSGLLTLHSTTGDIQVGGRLDVSGTAQSFYDVVRYTGGGEVRLVADAGSVTIGENATVNVSGAVGGGNAGAVTVQTPGGAFTLQGKLLAKAGDAMRGGSFALDSATVPGLGGLLSTLTESGFSEAQKFRVRTGDVLLDGSATAAPSASPQMWVQSQSVGRLTSPVRPGARSHWSRAAV